MRLPLKEFQKRCPDLRAQIDLEGPMERVRRSWNAIGVPLRCVRRAVVVKELSVVGRQQLEGFKNRRLREFRCVALLPGG